MRGKDYFIFATILFLCFFLVGYVLLLETRDGFINGNVISGKSIQFIEDFYFSEPLALVSEEPVALEIVGSDLAPIIQSTKTMRLSGVDYLEITGENFKNVYFVILDLTEIDLGSVTIDETQTTLRFPIEPGFSFEEHTIVIGAEGGESNTFFIQRQQDDFASPTDEPKDSAPLPIDSLIEEEPFLIEEEAILQQYGIIDPNPSTFIEAPETIPEIPRETNCIIEQIDWASTEISLDSSAQFTITGTDCDGRRVPVYLFEDDLFGDDEVSGETIVTFEGNTAAGQIFFETERFSSYLGGLEGPRAEFVLYFGSLENSGITGNAAALNSGQTVFSSPLSVGAGNGQGNRESGPQGPKPLYTNRTYIFEGCSDAYSIDRDCDGAYAVLGNTTKMVNYAKNLDPNDNNASIYDDQSLRDVYGNFTIIANLKRYLSDIGYGSARDVYFIDPVSGDDVTGRKNNISLPYRTFNELICDDFGATNFICAKSVVRGSGKQRELSEGDIVIFRNGTYAFVDFNLTNTKGYNVTSNGPPTVFLTFPGERVTIKPIIIPGNSKNLVFDGFNIRANTISGVLFLHGNQTNIALKRLDITSDGTYSAPTGISSEREGFRKNLSFDTIVAYDLYSGLSLGLNGSGDQISLRNSLIYRNSRDGVLFKGNATRLLFEYNAIHTNGLDGMSFSDGTQYSRFSNNLIFNNNWWSMRFITSPINGNGNYVGSNSNNVITNNVFWRGQETNGICDVTSCPPYESPANRTHIAFLHLETIPNRAIFFTNENNTLSNNIFYLSQNQSAISFRSPLNVSQIGRDFLETNIENNLFFESLPQSSVHVGYAVSICNWTDNTHQYAKPSTATCPNNEYSWHLNNPPKMINNIAASAQLESASTALAKLPYLFDFYPASTSPVRDIANPAVAPPLDIKRNPRPGVPDTGAYEILSGPFCRTRLDTRTCTKQVGVCAGSQEICTSGGNWAGCTFYDYHRHNSSYENEESRCDGFDNDCDGFVDEHPSCGSQPFRFTMNINPSIRSLTYGPADNSTSTSILIQKIGNGPNEIVSLSVSGLPTGAEHSLDKASCDFTVSRSCLVNLDVTFSALVNSLPQEHSITISASSPSHSASSTLSVTGIKNAPQLSSVSPAVFTNGTPVRLQFSGNNFDAIVNITANNEFVGIIASNNHRSVEFPLSASVPGVYDLRIVNLNGKTSSNFSVRVIDSATPILRTIYPNWARAGFSRTVELQGAGFSSSNIVRINGNIAGKTFIDANRITLTVPTNLPSGEHNVSVETATGRKSANATLHVLQDNSPAANTVSPSRVNNAYTQAISIHGENFSEFSAVQIQVGPNQWVPYPFLQTLPFNSTVMRLLFPQGYPPGIYSARIVNYDRNISNPVSFQIYNDRIIGPIPDFDLDGIDDNTDKCPKTPQQFHSLIDKRNGCPAPKVSRFLNNLSTNFSRLTSFKNISSFKVGIKDKALITFAGNVTPLRLILGYDMLYPLDLDAYINLSRNKASLDSYNLPELAVESDITFYNVSATNPTPFRNGTRCTDCVAKQWDEKTRNFVLNVKGWSEYEIKQGTCGDKYCSITETKTSCSTDCGSTGGSGGGGGGGGSGGGGGGGGGGPPSKLTKVNLDDGNSKKVTITEGTKLDVTLNESIYRLEITKTENNTATISFVNISRLLTVTALELYSVDITLDNKEDIELYLTKTGTTYELTLKKIQEQKQNRGENKKNNTQGDKKPIINEIAESFKPSQIGFWTLLIGTLLTILSFSFFELRNNQKPSQKIVVEKRPLATTTQAKPTPTTNQTSQKTTAQNSPVKPQEKPKPATPTSIYRYHSKRNSQTPMTELPIQKKTPVPTPSQKITETTQPAPTTTTAQKPLPREKPLSTKINDPTKLSAAEKNKILDESTEETEDFDPYA